MKSKSKIQFINDLEEITENNLEDYFQQIIEKKYTDLLLPQGLETMSPFSYLSFLFQYNQFIVHLVNDLLNRDYS